MPPYLHVRGVGLPVGARVVGWLRLYVTGPGVGPAPVGVGDHILWLGQAGVKQLEVLLHRGLEILDRGLSGEPAGQHVEHAGVAVVQGGEPVLIKKGYYIWSVPNDLLTCSARVYPYMYFLSSMLTMGGVR